jgi:DNA mismatch repair protein MutL
MYVGGLTERSIADEAGRQPIRALPALLVNQIAAGEVVDRPASVVKELVENSIDAGATRIQVDLEQGGIELIRVTDDGEGIPPGELPAALAPHATSKIRVADDLDRIATMGFRGEALASITSVARVSLRSRTRDEPGASVIDAEGDVFQPVRPAAGAVGTSIQVRNLFFNTPARRKFLRTPQTEQGHALDIVYSLAIAHPAIGFMATTDGRRVFDVPPGQGPRARALEVLGTELGPHLLEVSADSFDDARGIALWGLVGTPEIARATQKAQHLFLNGRVIRDRTVQHALRESYRGLIEPGRFPTAVLMIEMSPSAVDVNVHPAKAEVRFRDSSLVHSVILRAVRDALRRADLTPAVGAWATSTGSASTFGPGAGAGAGAGVGPGILSKQGEHSALAHEPGTLMPQAPMSQHAQHAASTALVEFLRRPTQQSLQASVLREALSPGAESAGLGPPVQAGVVSPPARDDRLLQVHNSFVVTQDEQGLLIVDQHALHERVMFEALLRRVLGSSGDQSAGDESEADEANQGAGSPLESQRLLMPVVVPTTRAQLSRLGELKPLLARIGISAEAIGPESVAVSAFPTFLFDRGVDPGEFVSELFDKADAEGFAPGSEQALASVLDMMACKAAVKAGDRMSDPELRDLLRLRDVVERSSNCPHGRPTSIRLTIKELEKRFGRS